MERARYEQRVAAWDTAVNMGSVDVKHEIHIALVDVSYKFSIEHQMIERCGSLSFKSTGFPRDQTESPNFFLGHKLQREGGDYVFSL